MTNADKCYLNIPFKETAKQLKVDKDGKLKGGQETLSRFAAQEFENYKSIERRINDPDCGGECGCESWIGVSETFANATSLIALSGNTLQTIAVDEWATVQSNGTIPSGLSTTALTPATPGLFQVSVSVQLADSSGTDDVQATVSLIANNVNMPDFVQGWVQSVWVPGGLGGAATVSAALPLGTGTSISVEVTLTAAAAATRELSIAAAGDNGGVMLSMFRICSCTALPGSGGG